MGKKKVCIIIGIVVCVLCVFIVGVLNRKGKESSDTQKEEAAAEAEMPTESGTSNDSEILTEGEFSNQVAEDEKVRKERGNIFEEGEYQSYAGFGYRVNRFEILDSYESITQMPDYDERGLVIPPYKYPEAQYAHIEIEVTNERNGEQRFYPGSVRIVFAQNGHALLKSNQNLLLAASLIYVGGLSYADDEHNGYNPLMKENETITFQLYYEYSYVDEGSIDTTTGTIDRYRMEEVFERPEYYVSVDGLIQTGESVDDVSKDNTHIYFKCEPEGAE